MNKEKQIVDEIIKTQENLLKEKDKEKECKLRAAIQELEAELRRCS
jgi:hypothetical protein